MTVVAAEVLPVSMSLSDKVEQVNSQTAGVNPLACMLTVHFGLLQVAENENDKRLVARVLYALPQVRRLMDGPTLSGLLSQVNGGEKLLHQINIEKSEGKSTLSVNKASESYVLLLYALFLLDKGFTQESSNILMSHVIPRLEAANKRHLDALLARSFYFLTRCHEMLQVLPSLHHQLMISFRQTALRQDTESHAVIYNSLLRILILQDEFDSASKFITHSPFPSQKCSGAQQARHHFYLASIYAVQGLYVEAKDNLIEALRKAPHGKTAAGFVQSVNKLLVVVQLLLGEIPERGLFRMPQLQGALRPYFALTQAVRLGDLSRFQAVLSEMNDKFKSDRTLNLVQRLHSNVLTAGLKRLCLSYTRIPLSDVCSKLSLPSIADAEFVLLKAIKEGLIDAQLIHSVNNTQGGYLQTNAISTPYYTAEPQETLHTRIHDMNSLHNECVRAMRYPQGMKKSTSDGQPMPTEAELIEEYLDADGDF